MSEFDIRPLYGSPQIRQALSEILVEVVANGGSVSFMHPLAVEEADAFWEGSLAAAARGERVVLGAFDGETLVATLTLILKVPPNQPHRAELAKMMTRPSHRGRGAARSLVLAAQQLAQQHGKTHLMLDTAADEGAELRGRTVGQGPCAHALPSSAATQSERANEEATGALVSFGGDARESHGVSESPLR